MTASRAFMPVGLCALAVALVPACDEGPGEGPPGYLSVLVTDPYVGPVAGQEVTITPPPVTATTNAEGLATVTLLPGDYVVKALVCCVGPGFIAYDETVSVAGRDTTHLALTACLTCD